MATSAQTYEQPAIRVRMEDISGLPAEFETGLAEGRHVEFVRGDKVIAEVRAPEATQFRVTAATFDWAAQLKEMWGDRVFDEDTTQWIREDRDARG